MCTLVFFFFFFLFTCFPWPLVCKIWMGIWDPFIDSSTFRCDGERPCSTCRESAAECRYKELPVERYECSLFSFLFGGLLPQPLSCLSVIRLDLVSLACCGFRFFLSAVVLIKNPDMHVGSTFPLAPRRPPTQLPNASAV